MDRLNNKMHYTGAATIDHLPLTLKLADQLRRDLHDLGAVPEARAVAALNATAVAFGIVETEAKRQAEVVVTALKACDDLGSGCSYGDRVLVKRRALSILLQGDQCILLGGDPSQGEPHGLLRTTDLVPQDVVSFFDHVGHLSDDEVAGLWQLLDVGVWYLDFTPPAAIIRLLCLAGIVPGQKITDGVSTWLREQFPMSQNNGNAADESQLAVINSPASARQIITAGPGSGKTHTATERVINLVQQGISPARICLIAFTRVAAEEVGRRISDALGEHTYSGGVVCGTIDSLAWNLVTTLGDAPSGGYQRVIRTARKAITGGEQAMLDQISRISHLVIDEAQDIVGERRMFCRALIDAMPSSIGVTILGDSAQAIYGSWAGDKEGGGSLHAELRDGHGWENRQLAANHRTRSAELQQFFRQARALLETGGDPHSTYIELREMLEDVATDPNVSLTGPVFPWRDDSLILFRGRAATEAASVRLTRAARTHRLKLSGQTTVCDPVVGAICAGVSPRAAIHIEHVRRRLADLHPAPFALEAEEILADLQGLGNGSATRLQEIGETIDREPVEHTRDHVGTAGPLLGSIHGAKGREASNVLLMLPPVPTREDVDWQEEARVLFVGATRASTNLYLGRAQSTMVRSGRNGSRWLRGNGGGLLLSGTEGLRPLAGIAPALSVWEAAFQQPSCSFRRASPDAGAPWRLFTERGEPLAEVQATLAEELDYIEATGEKIASGTIRVVGASTIVDRRSDGRIVAVTLLPVLQGVARGGKDEGIEDDR